MQDSAIYKAGSTLLGLKEEIDGLTVSIKTAKKEMDDELEQALMKASSMVEINKNMEEIQLAGKMVLKLIKDEDIKPAEKLLGVLRRKIYDTQVLLAKYIQKSMLKATQDLAEAENGMMLMNGLNDMVKKFNIIIEKVHMN